MNEYRTPSVDLVGPAANTIRGGIGTGDSGFADTQLETPLASNLEEN
jgi:hypothetical protein